MTIATHPDSESDKLDDQIASHAFSNEDLQAFAIEAGVRDAAWSFPPELRLFAEIIAERCACLGDRYTGDDGNAGEEIRAAFGLG